MNGALWLGELKSVFPYPAGFNYERAATAPRPDRAPDAQWTLWGFHYRPREFRYESGWVAIPYWFFVAVFTAATFLAWRARRPSPSMLGGFPMQGGR